jgi:hypothetical protein
MIAWILATMILTPLVAMFLAIWGYIPFDVFTAGISGVLVAFVYVGFRIANANRSNS